MELSWKLRLQTDTKLTRDDVIPVKSSETRESSDVKHPEARTTHSVTAAFAASVQEWAGATTFHGIRYVFDQDSHFMRRIFWFLVLVGMLSLLVWNGQIQMIRYSELKTLSVETVYIIDQLTFPSLTLCLSSFIKNDSFSNESERILVKELLLLRPNRTRLVTEFGVEFLNSSAFSLRTMVLQHSVNLDDVIKSCVWEGQSLNCTEIFSTSFTDSGICFTLKEGERGNNMDTHFIGDMSGLELVLWTSQNDTIHSEITRDGLKVSVQDPVNEPDMKTTPLRLGPGMVHYLALYGHQYDYLPYPVQALGGGYCVDTSVTPEYSVGVCKTHGRDEYTVRQCQCSSYFDLENATECTPLQYVDCYSKVIVPGSQYHCPLPCHLTKYIVTHAFTFLPKSSFPMFKDELFPDKDVAAIQENMLVVKVFYGSKEVTFHEEVLEFTIEDLWASFGGYMGLTMGASIITLLEVVDLLGVNIYRHFRNIHQLARR